MNLFQIVDSLLLQACAVDEETKVRLKAAIEGDLSDYPGPRIRWNDGVYPR